tara:strand:+ start:157 stop:423 length:267 start_codon:yes stop_codon:yes gene_type:complete
MLHISLVIPRRLDQDLMNRVFDKGATVIDAGIIRCENEKIKVEVEGVLDEEDVEYYEIEYTPRRIFSGIEDKRVISMLLSLMLKKVFP